MVGCPAIGNSTPGVKMRMRTSVPSRSFGRMNVVSEKFISRAMVCIMTGVEAAAIGKHRKLVTFEAPIGEHVVLQIVQAGHEAIVRDR